MHLKKKNSHNIRKEDGDFQHKINLSDRKNNNITVSNNQPKVTFNNADKFNIIPYAENGHRKNLHLGGEKYTYPFLQPKLKVNKPGDKYEQEADRIAEEVTNSDSSFIQRSSCSSCQKEDDTEEIIQTKSITNQITPLIQRQEDDESDEEEILDEEENEEVMMKSMGAGNTEITSSVSNQINSTRGQGSLMPEMTKNFMENSFGTDFSRVRIHHNQQATNLNRKLNSRAFTLGNDIYFNSGQYNPNQKEGKKLLAHELTHVIQQNGARSKVSFKRFSKSYLTGISKVPGGIVQRNFLTCHKKINPKFKSSIAIGNEAERQIQNYYQRRLGRRMVFNVEAASSEPFRDKRGRVRPISIFDHIKRGVGVPDIAYKSSTGSAGLLAEIKPGNWGGLLLGEMQLLNYINKGNSTENAALRARLGVKVFSPMLGKGRFRGPRSIRVFGKRYNVFWCGPGILLYAPPNPRKKKKKSKKKQTKKSGKQGKKGGTKGGAYNFGLGISLFGVGGGAGNVGVGVSISSNGFSVGTVSAGIVYNSDGVAVGAASAGMSKDSMGAGAGVAGAGKSEGDMSAGAGVAGAGSSKDNVVASAGSAGSGSSKGQTGAQAGKSGKAGGKSKSGLKVEGMTQAETDKAVQQAAEIDKLLQKASPAQKKLLAKIIQKQQDKVYDVPDPQWVEQFLATTEGISEAEADKLADSINWTPGGVFQRNVKPGKANSTSSESGDQERSSVPKGSENASGTQLNLHSKAQKVYMLILSKKGIKITQEAQKLNLIIPKDFTDEQMRELERRLSQLKKSDQATIETVLKALSLIVKEIKEGKSPAGQPVRSDSTGKKKPVTTPDPTRSRDTKSSPENTRRSIPKPKENLASKIPVMTFVKKDERSNLMSKKEITDSNNLIYTFNENLAVNIDKLDINIVNRRLNIGGKDKDVQVVSISLNVTVSKAVGDNNSYGTGDKFSWNSEMYNVPSTGNTYLLKKGQYEYKVDELTEISNDRVALKSGVLNSIKNLGEVEARIIGIKNIESAGSGNSKMYSYEVNVVPTRIIQPGISLIVNNKVTPFAVNVPIRILLIKTTSNQ